MARMTRGTGEWENNILDFNAASAKKRRGIASFMNLLLLLTGVYVALFVGSITKWVLLLAIVAVYVSQKLDIK